MYPKERGNENNPLKQWALVIMYSLETEPEHRRHLGIFGVFIPESEQGQVSPQVKTGQCQNSAC